MLGLALWLAIGVVVILILTVGFKTTNWKSRTVGWLLLLMPFAVFMRNYPLTYYRHWQICEKEGGLKIYERPKVTNRLRLDGGSFNEDSAKSILYKYYPQIIVVEASQHIERPPHKYFAYSVMTNNQTQKKNWNFRRTTSESLNDVYTLSTVQTSENKMVKVATKLTKNSKLYASYTTIYHTWANGPFGPLRFYCFHPYEKQIDPEDELIRLISER